MSPIAAPSATEISRPTRARAHEVAVAELDAMLDLLRSLSSDDWHCPTDCDEWDVHKLVSHLAGTCEDSAHMTRLIRRFSKALRTKGVDLVDAMNASQVDERNGSSPDRLVAEMEAIGPKAVRARGKMPAPLRALRIPLGALGMTSIAYLNDVLYTRDMWTHRMDISLATGRELEYRGHETEIVEQVILDLGRSWDARPCVIELDGYVSGAWVLGEGEPVATATVDCLDYMRALSGRNDEPLIAVEGDVKAAEAVAAARVVF